MDIPSWCRRLADDLELLRELAAACPKIAQTAPFTPNPTLDETVVATFEATHEVALPADYRELVLFVGDGGFGPAYGINPLAAYQPRTGLPDFEVTVTGAGGLEATAGTGPRPELERPAELARPFPLAAPWRPVDDSGELVPLPVPPGVHPYDGTLELAEIGCGYAYLLVVSGESRGGIWVDYTAGDGALAPEAPSFRAWIERWVDRQIAGAFAGAAQGALEAGAPSPGHDAIERAAARVAACAEAHGEDVVAQAARAMVSLYRGERGEAAEAIERVRTLEPESHWMRRLAAYYHAGDIARAAASPPQGAEALARHPAAVVRKTLAGNAAAPPRALEILAASPEPAIASLLATNPSSPPALIADLAARLRRDFEERPENLGPLLSLERALRRDDAPPALIEEIVRWSAGRVAGDRRLAVALRGAALAAATPAALLAELAAHPLPEVRHGVARHPRATAELIARLAGDADPFVRAGVAARRDAAPALLAALAGDEHPAPRENAARNPATPLAALRLLAARNEYGLAYYLLRNPALPDDLVSLAELHPQSHERSEIDPAGGAGDEIDGDGMSSSAPADDAVRAGKVRHHAYPVAALAAALGQHMGAYNMASRPWLDAALIERLAADDYAYTRLGIARRHDVGAAVLERLAADPSPMVRGGAALRVSGATLQRLLSDESDEVLEQAAQNPEAPEAALRRLATHPTAYVRRGVARNPEVPADLLAELAGDESEFVRRFVPLSPAASPEILDRLAADSDESVRRAVAWRRRAMALGAKS